MKWVERQKISSLQLCLLKLLGLQEIDYTVFQKMLFDSFLDHPHPLRNYAPEQPFPHFTGKVIDAATAADLILSRFYFFLACQAGTSVHTHWDPVRLQGTFIFVDNCHTACIVHIRKNSVCRTGPSQEHQHLYPLPAHTVLFPQKFLKFWAQRCLYSCLVTA